jgi:hypothetical protein
MGREGRRDADGTSYFICLFFVIDGYRNREERTKTHRSINTARREKVMVDWDSPASFDNSRIALSNMGHVIVEL